MGRRKPVDRHYIEDFLRRHAADIRGRVLEVGEETYTIEYGSARVTQRDILHADGSNAVLNVGRYLDVPSSPTAR